MPVIVALLLSVWPIPIYSARYLVARSRQVGDQWTCSPTTGCAQQCLQPMRQCPPGAPTWRSDQRQCVATIDGKTDFSVAC